MPVAEAVQQREEFFVKARLEESMTGCGDDRPIAGLETVHIGLFGGPAANTASSLMVLQEARDMQSVQEPFAKLTASMVPLLEGENIITTVHSDQKTEGGDVLDPYKEAEGDLGCAYAKLRQAIFQIAGQRGEEIAERLTKVKPARYANPEGRVKIERFIPVFAALGERDSLFTTGRDVAAQAMEAGAKGIVVEGAHVAKVGIFNEVEESTFDSRAAWNAELPAYNHNSWAARQIFKTLQECYPYDVDDFQTVNDIDTMATMLALGLEDIKARS